jgi:predicted ATPase
LVGRNGSGKSNVADALAFLSEAMEWPLQTVFNRRGGPLSVARRTPRSPSLLKETSVNFGLCLEFQELSGWDKVFRRRRVDARYSFLININPVGFQVMREQCIVTANDGSREWFDRTGSKLSSSIELIKDGNLPVTRDALVMPFFGTFPQLAAARDAVRSMAVYAIDPGKLREFQDPDAGRRLVSDGSNAASVLRELMNESDSYSRLFEILATVVPDLERVRPQTIGRKQHLRFWQRWSDGAKISFDAFNMSDGTLRAFGILLALYQADVPKLLVIEEPETSLHPMAVASVVETLRLQSKHTQIIVSTHSPDVLEFASPEDRELRVVTWRVGTTTLGMVEGAAKVSLQKYLASAGELLRMSILDASPLFSNPEDGSPVSNPEDNLQGRLFEELS